jgi:hypothetical protein
LPAAVSPKSAGSHPLQLWRHRLRAVPVELSWMMPERLAALDALVERSREVLDAASLKARAMLRTGEEFGWAFVSLGPLPEGIGSPGLFVLPARSRPTPHRHPTQSSTCVACLATRAYASHSVTKSWTDRSELMSPGW